MRGEILFALPLDMETIEIIALSIIVQSYLSNQKQEKQ